MRIAYPFVFAIILTVAHAHDCDHCKSRACVLGCMETTGRKRVWQPPTQKRDNRILNLMDSEDDYSLPSSDYLFNIVLLGTTRRFPRNGLHWLHPPRVLACMLFFLTCVKNFRCLFFFLTNWTLISDLRRQQSKGTGICKVSASLCLM